MTENMKRFVDIITADINSKFGDDLPSLEDINTSADRMRSALGVIYPITDEEFSFVKKTLSLPAWLAALADEKNVNCSKIFQDALKNFLGVEEPRTFSAADGIV